MLSFFISSFGINKLVTFLLPMYKGAKRNRTRINAHETEKFSELALGQQDYS